MRLREVLKEGYIPFTYPPDNDNVSAEFYCADDVYNYDNFDFIRNLQEGETYYCVAFNAPLVVEPQCSISGYKYNDVGGGLINWIIGLAQIVECATGEEWADGVASYIPGAGIVPEDQVPAGEFHGWMAAGDPGCAFLTGEELYHRGYKDIAHKQGDKLCWPAAFLWLVPEPVMQGSP